MARAPAPAPPSRLRLVVALLIYVCAAHAGFAQVVGDLDCDGSVDDDDLGTLLGSMFDHPAACDADTNGDGKVTSADVPTLVGLRNTQGPEVTALGLAGADGVPVQPFGQIGSRPVYIRSSGLGFKIIIEGKAGVSGLGPGLTTFDSDPDDPTRRPDVQIQATLPMGDGSPSVCDGGVPGMRAPDFGPTQVVADMLNDFACHFLSSTSSSFACTQNAFGDLAFVSDESQVQFCLQVSSALAFSAGETLVSARLRDESGNLGPLRQIILRVGQGPVPATFTRTPSATPTAFVPTPTTTATPTRSATPTPSVRPATFTPSRSPTATRVITPMTPTRTPTGPTPTRTPPTPPSPTRTSTRTATPTRTGTSTPSPSRTASRSPTQTATPAGPIGPVITFFGITRADDTLSPPDPETGPGGEPIYTRTNGTGFSLVVEGKQGPSGSLVGRFSYTGDPMMLADLQIQTTQALGNGSAAVCDRSGSTAGGVPGIVPPTFDLTLEQIGTVNDLSCRFVDGGGAPFARRRNEACVKFLPTEDFDFVDEESTVQYCAFISNTLRVPEGETVITVRLRDEDGNVGEPGRLIVRVPVVEELR